MSSTMNPISDDLTEGMRAVLAARHPQPHAFLGMHPNAKSGYLEARTFQPGAIAVSIVAKDSGKVVSKLTQQDDSGIFINTLRRKRPFNYLLKVAYSDSEQLLEDPFSFDSLLSDLDIHLLSEGKHDNAYDKMGAHITKHDDVKGASFAVWAPNASSVSVVGDFNEWDGRRHPMANRNQSGIWDIFIPALHAGQHYKFEIKDAQQNVLPLKADPYGSAAQLRPNTASVLVEAPSFVWQDKSWLESRELRNRKDAPISIYEVHLGSWKRGEDNSFLNYRELADQLVPYATDMGFTHVQLMPVSEFPFDGSWGYQPVGLFAPTSRFGSSDDFQYFVNKCHQAELGLLIDWVPGHFPDDPHGLARFDGTHLYEHADPKQGFHPDWNTLIYNYGRQEVANFLTASAMVWMDKYHVDGIRVDAVASMLYLDYSREPGEWVPNHLGGRENLEAVAFIQNFNRTLYRDYPGAFTVAEESTAWPGVCKSVDEDGLGFGYKWNMGWMNDTLEYIKRDPVHRQHHHNEISFGLVYAFDENFILPLSHDEVVHGKGSMIEKMPGDGWQKFANLRAYYGFMWAHPGKKLIFMGSEFAQGKEWDHDNSLDWHQLDIDCHQGVQNLVKDLNNVYRSKAALHQKDCEGDGFSWLDYENADQSIFAFVRYGKDQGRPVIVVSNFTPQTHDNFRIGAPEAGHYKEILNTDAEVYGGSNQGNLGGVSSEATVWQNQPNSLLITVPPLSTVMFELI
jgi:1,4-alpha-glucan branching enzyme